VCSSCFGGVESLGEGLKLGLFGDLLLLDFRQRIFSISNLLAFSCSDSLINCLFKLDIVLDKEVLFV